MRKWLGINILHRIHYNSFAILAHGTKPLSLLVVTSFFALYGLTLNAPVGNSAELSPNVPKLVTAYPAKCNDSCAFNVRENPTQRLSKGLQKQAPINLGTVALNFERLADAIKRAENSKSKPYGIMKDYCSAQTEAQCRKGCLQTIQKAYSRYIKGPRSLDFISFLALTYAPIGASNDPTGLNKNWIRNVRYFYDRLG